MGGSEAGKKGLLEGEKTAGGWNLEKCVHGLAWCFGDVAAQDGDDLIVDLVLPQVASADGTTLFAVAPG